MGCGDSQGENFFLCSFPRCWLSWPSARFRRRTSQGTTTSDFRKGKVDSVKRREEIKVVKALKTRRAAGSAFAVVILMLAEPAAHPQTSAPPPVGAEPATADNAILLTVFLKHDQSRPLSELNGQFARQGFYKAFPPDRGGELVCRDGHRSGDHASPAGVAFEGGQPGARGHRVGRLSDRVLCDLRL